MPVTTDFGTNNTQAMKPHTLFLILGILLLGVFSCEQPEGAPETSAFSLSLVPPAGEVVPGDNTVLPQLVYHLFIFRSETSTPSSNDGSDYIFWERTEEKGLDLEEIQNYTLSIPTEYTDRFYLLLLHATPKQKPESVVLSGEGMTFTDSEISMVRENDNSYIPLSKDNYYAIQALTPEDITQGKTSIEFKLKRAVGELVFDVMKCDEKGNPIDIDAECSSTLDRVFQIDMEVSGVTPKVSLTNETKKPERIDICFSKTVTLKEDTYFPVFESNKGIIELLNDAPLDIGHKAVNGATRICGPYLFSKITLDNPETGVAEIEEGVKAVLKFSYYDTTPFPPGSYNTQKLTLSLTDKPLTIVKDHYTVTNIRLRNNRIIDLSVSGNYGIDWKWD